MNTTTPEALIGDLKAQMTSLTAAGTPAATAADTVVARARSAGAGTVAAELAARIQHRLAQGIDDGTAIADSCQEMTDEFRRYLQTVDPAALVMPAADVAGDPFTAPAAPAAAPAPVAPAAPASTSWEITPDPTPAAPAIAPVPVVDGPGADLKPSRAAADDDLEDNPAGRALSAAGTLVASLATLADRDIVAARQLAWVIRGLLDDSVAELTRPTKDR